MPSRLAARGPDRTYARPTSAAYDCLRFQSEHPRLDLLSIAKMDERFRVHARPSASVGVTRLRGAPPGRGAHIRGVLFLERSGATEPLTPRRNTAPDLASHQIALGTTEIASTQKP